MNAMDTSTPTPDERPPAPLVWVTPGGTIGTDPELRVFMAELQQPERDDLFWCFCRAASEVAMQEGFYTSHEPGSPEHAAILTAVGYGGEAETRNTLPANGTRPEWPIPTIVNALWGRDWTGYSEIWATVCGPGRDPEEFDAALSQLVAAHVVTRHKGLYKISEKARRGMS